MKTGPETQGSDTIAMVGRVFVSVALVVFGIQHFMYAGFVGGLVPAWMPARLFLAYFTGVAFFAAAVGILIQRTMRPAGTLLGVMFLLFVTTLHIPRIAAHSGNANEWTSGFVALAMCGGAWILAMASPLDEREIADPFLRLGRYFFALVMVAFGIQHFVFAKLASGLGPPWIPGRPFWTYVPGAILISTAVAIVFGSNIRLAATLLGTLIFLYSRVLYLPRIAAHPRDPGPWTSGFELLAMSGCALVLGSTRPRQERE